MKKSLFLKMLLMNIAVVATALAVIALLLPQLISGYIFSQKENELTAKGKELARLTASYHDGRIDDDSFLELLLALDQFLEARIWVVNPEGQVIKASYGERQFRRGPRLHLSAEQVKQMASGEIVVGHRYMPHFEQVMLSVGVPVILGGQMEPAGAIVLHAPVTEINATVANLRRLVLYSGLTAVFLASILGFIFSRRLSRPLKEMTVAAKRMGRGEYSSRINVASEDELGQLAFSLNSLAGKLEKTISALQQEKDKFKSMVSGMLEGVVSVNGAGIVTYVNRPAKQMLGLEEISPGCSVTELCPSPELAAPFLDTLTGKKPESATVTFNGNHYLIRVSPAEDESGCTQGAVALIQDISETERLEQMRRDFIANVSHELRTPLTVLRGYTEALIDGTVEQGAQARYLQIIRSEINRLNTLIEDLLDLSRLQAGRLQLNRKPFNIKELTVELVTRIKPRLEEKGLTARIGIAPDLVVIGDRNRILQVMLNLLENAIRFSPEKGTLAIDATIGPEKKARIEIHDEGPGIPPEELPSIWERFYRVEKSRDRSKGGTGLGLAIVREIIEAHDETVIVENAATQGAVFSFTLPLFSQ